MLTTSKSDALTSLRADILRMQGFKPCNSVSLSVLGPMAAAFPNATFPLGAIHEFVTDTNETAAATSGFISCLLTSLTQAEGVILWIGKNVTSTKIFPPALLSCGLKPERFLFVNVRNDKDTLWVMEEALKCGALTAVVAEMSTLSFMASRRLQLAVEQSQVTGFVMRTSKQTSQTACVSRWHIAPRASVSPDGIPGVGHAAWQVNLEKIRNGKSGSWHLQWIDHSFALVPSDSIVPAPSIRKAV